MQALNLFDLVEKTKVKKMIRLTDLKPINNLKLIFREIRDYFAGNVTGITRDEKIAQNIMRLLFCKIYDEKNSDIVVEFSNRPNENYDIFYKRISNLFEKVKINYPGIFEQTEKIEIKPEELSFIVSKLEDYSIINADRDVVGDAFEELIGTSFRGGEGQFFTPRNVVQMMIDVLSPQEGERVIDPACGSGGFLAYTLRHYISSNVKNFYLAGIDKDAFLSKIAKIYLSLLGDDEFDIFCENSLEVPEKWSSDTKKKIELGTFDVVLTNPPFGAKIPVIGKELLSQYQLGHKWENGNKWIQTNKLLDKQPPQVLFIERCLQLLSNGGRLGIVLPEGIFGNPSDRYIWEYISSVASITSVVSLPQETFQPSTHTKTSVLFLKKTTERPKSIFMAMANSVGHNKNGKPIYKIDKSDNKKVLDDDLPIIAKKFNSYKNNNKAGTDHLGFNISYDELNDHIFIPEYYNPEIIKEIETLKKSGKYLLLSIGNSIDKGVLQIRRGNEIGSQFYGTGEVPFVRTSDIVNWEIKVDPVKAVSEEVYNQYKELQDIQENDILFVNDGTFLIGRTAMVTKLDLKIIIQSHVRKIRVLDNEFIDPFYLFYLLNSKIVRKQIDSKTFVQATISTIGNRLREVILPISKDQKEIKKIIKEIKDIIEKKADLREKIVKIVDNSI
ncbi:MAG TPA: N-6 DNA methylase [Candidatus Paceibacterota bacterium]|nr:N-6 DNA methylase [Candidatus Paceibacterota bacterium]